MIAFSKNLIAASLVLLPPYSAWAGTSAPAPSTTNVHGQAGLTDYSGFPFGSSIYGNSWGSVNALPGDVSYAPANLFWSAGSFFNNPGYMAAARAAAAGLAQQGIVPASTAQRWEDTFEISQPASNFGNEPAWLVADRANNGGTPFNELPEYQAWVAWENARPNLQAVANDSGSMGQDFRPWGGTWGFISPMMPLSPADCPPGMRSCTYGDWYAYRWAQTSQASGAYGIVLSDFSNSLPGQPSWTEDFNPAIVKDFASKKQLKVPASTTSVQAPYIVNNALPLWNDYICEGYATFFNALATRITAATGQQALVVAGGFDWPGLNRSWGADDRIMLKQPGLASHLLVVWDDITIEPDRDGDNITEGMAGSVIAAAREPAIRIGAYLSADDSNFWASVAQFNPTLSASDQQEWGLKQLKRQWLDFAWAQIGSRNGHTRRALAFAWRDHWDAGTVDPTTTSLIQTINPVRPFGYALYYSVAVERAIEPSVPATLNAYLSPKDLLALRQAVPVNYFVSDAGLPNMVASAAPAGWIVLDAGNNLPPLELAALTKIAPVFTSAAQALAYANAPLSFTGGLTGTSFIDQHGRIIVTVTNPSTAANAGTINGTMTLRGVQDGKATLTDLYTNTATRLTISGGTVTIPVSVTRWDTRAFALSR
jgi:hypothetical protein